MKYKSLSFPPVFKGQMRLMLSLIVALSLLSLLSLLSYPTVLSSPRDVLPSVSSSTCFRIHLKGRLGNLMFEVASLVGVCVKRGLSPDKCASLSGNVLSKNATHLPLFDFSSQFRLPVVKCKKRFVRGEKDLFFNSKHYVYEEHSERPFSVEYDENVFEQPYQTTLLGYMQSYKYFHPHAQEHVRKMFTFVPEIVETSTRYIDGIRESYPATSNPSDGYAVNCVSVRRGDKIGVNGTTPQGYAPWALSTDYYHQAISLVKERNKKNVFIVFVGGSFDPKTRANDRNWVTENLIGKFSDGNTVLLLEPEDFSHFTVLSAMSQCDNLIVSSSSFSWWAAYLAKPTCRIVAPRVLHDDTFGFVPEDYYPPEWTLLGPRN